MPYPEYIDVRITGEHRCFEGIRYDTQSILFKEYVKTVLANEWGADWTELDSLKAGAVAVKNYALNKYESRGYLWDCNWDQVYDPAIRRDLHNRAVDTTWNTLLLRDGEILRTHYGGYPYACEVSNFGEGNCMSQWVSLYQARRGMSWREILGYAYRGTLVTNRIRFEKIPK